MYKFDYIQWSSETPQEVACTTTPDHNHLGYVNIADSCRLVWNIEISTMTSDHLSTK